MAILSPDAIQAAIARLSDPKVNYRLDLASTPHVAKRIIESLPGVKELSESGPEAEEAFLELLRYETTLQDEHLSAISVHILESYPSERVKVALAKPISDRKFIGMSTQLAAETFLKAAGIEALQEDAIKIAMREAKKYQMSNTVDQAEQ
jgi:hypothetical protein